MACMCASGSALALQRQVKLFTKLAHPADLLGRHPHHQGIGLHIFIDHGTGPHKRKLTNGHTADHCAVGAQGGAFFNESVAVFVFALDEGTGVVHVGEHHAGAAKHAFFECDVVVHADVVLHFAAVTDGDLVADKDVLAEGHAFAYPGAAAHMDKVPDAGAFANLGAFVNDGGGVDGVGHIQMTGRGWIPDLVRDDIQG
jgi:hypothetical protein